MKFCLSKNCCQITQCTSRLQNTSCKALKGKNSPTYNCVNSRIKLRCSCFVVQLWQLQKRYAKRVLQQKSMVFFFGVVLQFEHLFHTDLCKKNWVYFCILCDINSKLGSLKKPSFPHFPTNKMFVVLVGWCKVRQDSFAIYFNILQEIIVKFVIKGLTLNANMDKFVKMKNCYCQIDLEWMQAT